MDAPPKTLVKTLRDQTRAAVVGDPQGAPSYLQSFPRGAPGALPVLEAFHQFLEKERRRAQRRAAALASFFVALILLLVAAGGALGGFFFRQTTIEIGGVRRDLSDFQNRAQEVRQRAEQALAGVSAQRTQIAADLDEARKAAAAARTDTAGTLQKQDATLARLLESISALERQEKAMRDELAVWKKELESQQARQMDEKLAAFRAANPPPPPARTEPPTPATPAPPGPETAPPAVTAVDRPARLPGMSSEPGAEVLVRNPPATNTMLGSRSTLDIAIPPGVGGRSVNWRIPIPE